MKKQHVIVLIALLATGTILNASRFYSIISIDNSGLGGINGMNANGDVFRMVDQSHQHGNGWGLMYYVYGEFGNPVIINGLDGNGPEWRSDRAAYRDAGQISAIFTEIRQGGFFGPDDSDPTDEVNCVIGHIRKAPSGCGSGPGESYPEGPHPFIKTLPSGKTFSFAHNGTLDKDVLRTLITDVWMIENNFIPQTYNCGSDWQSDGWDHVIDSELYFFWIIKNIMDDPAGDITRGIQKALSESAFNDLDGEKNFVLSNGEALWSFRWAPSDDSTNPDYAHTVFWRYTHEPTLNRYYAAIVSQPYQNDIEDWNLLNNHDALVKSNN